MSTSFLLTTKFFIPTPAANLVARPDLYARLDAGLPGKLILISAPAGFGKTTLVVNWLAARATRDAHGWLALDVGDNHLPRFLAYTIGALQQTDARLGVVAQAALHSPSPPPSETVLTSLINDLAQFAQPIILVLDDYHTITTPEIHHALEFLVDHLPPNVHLVMTTREDPPIALARLRARGHLAEIRAADLRFDRARADEFLNRGMALGLAPADVAKLAERTEGWVAGLRLAALALQNENAKSDFIHAFSASHRFVTDYLLDEVLARTDAATRSFLLRTSFLHRLCAPLCDAVLGDTTSQTALRHVEQANLFLVPLDDSRTWYRYHHLFAQFLQLRLKESEPALIAELYQRALAWCATQGYAREALAYALEMRDWQRAADLIETLASLVLSSEGAFPLLQWLAALPDNLIRQRPRLCLHYAWALSFTGKMAQADEYLGAAESACASEPDAKTKATILGYVSAHRAHLAFFRGRYPQTIQDAQYALAHLPVDDDVMRARTATLLAFGLRYAGDYASALDAHGLASTVSEKTGNLYTITFNLGGLQELYRERGQLRQAMATCERALALARQSAGRADLPFTGFTYLAMGVIEREWNQLERARAHMQQGETLCREWRQADALAIGLMSAAFLYQDLGEYALARAALEEARHIIGDIFSAWGTAMVNAFVAQLDLARGDVDAATRWMQASGLSIHDKISFERGDEYQSLAQVLTVQGKFVDALSVWEQLYQQYKSVGRFGRVLQVAAWRAHALAGAGRRADARDALQDALAWGEPENYVRSFVNAGPLIADLLRELPASDYRDHLLAAFPQVPTAPRSSASVILPEPLSERELEILRLVADGHSNQRIADELVITLNTVKKHTSNLFGKLGVTSRTQALARARELGLL